MKKVILALFVGLVFIVGPFLVKADMVPTTPVSISAYFDETNSDVSSLIPPQPYGSKVSFSNHLPNAPEGYESYEFAYWIVNGVVRSDLNFNAQFRVTDHLDLVAIYRPANKYVVVFMDTNGKMIDLDYVSPGSAATAPNVSSLSKPGLVVQSLNPWSVDFSEVTSNMVVWVQYESATEVTYAVSTTNGSGGGENLEFGSVANVTADETSGSDVFTHWVDENGKVVSYQLNHSFTVYKDTTLTAVYGDTASNLPSVVISDRMSFHSNKSTYIGQFYIPEGYELIEYGTITSMVQGAFYLETEGILRNQSNKHNGPTKEFMMSISAATSQYIRGYLVVEDESEQLHYFYSSIEKTRDLMFSEYGEGSSNNKWIEIYNPTCETISLAAYQIAFNGYTTQGAVSTSTYSLSGDLLPGDVFLIANSQAVQAIKDHADATTTTVVAFTGDDALSIYKGDTLIDRFGIVGPDPGDYWEIGEGTTQDHTIIRNVGVFAPATSWVLDEWSVFGVDYFGNLGFHQNVSPSSLTIFGDDLVESDQSIQLSVSYAPRDAIRGVTWESEHPAIATVSPEGLVTGVSEGFATITVTSTVDNEITDTFVVEVFVVEEMKVSFETNGGSSIDDQFVDEGDTATEPANPTKYGYLFVGWFTDNTSFEHEFDFGTSIEDDITLYAKWSVDPDTIFGNDLFISEYIEGSGTIRALEIYNGTGTTINLADYRLLQYNNGKTTADAGYTLALTGLLSHANVAVIYYTIGPSPALISAAEKAEVTIATNSGMMNFNGDDAISLQKSVSSNWVHIDVIGVIGTDPGSYWGSGVTKTQDQTLCRKPYLYKGDTNGSDAFNPADEWVGYATDFFGNLGAHEVHGVAPSSLDITGPTSVFVDSTIELSVSVGGDSVTPYVIWSSSNVNVATVDQNGTVTGIAVGSVTITAKSEVDDSVLDTIVVSVVEPQEFDISVVVNNEDWGTAYADPTTVTTGNSTRIYFSAEEGYFVSTIKIGSGSDIDVKGMESYLIEDIEDDITVYVTFEEGEAQLTEQVIYYTGIEDATKAAYAIGDVTLSGVVWSLNNALIGSSASDKKIDSKSIRSKTSGDATMLSGFSRVTKIEFQYARYGTDTGVSLSVFISADGVTWVQIMAPVNAGSINDLIQETIVIDYDNALLTAAGITPSSIVRFRFAVSGTTDKRINIDEIKIFGYAD